MPYPFTAITAVSSEYLATGHAAAGDKFDPNYSSMEGYVAAKMMVEGLRRTGNNLNVDGVINGLESLRELNLGGFFVDFNSQKHTGSKFVELTILQADGRVRR